MINPPEKGVRYKNKSNKKGVCDQCGVCRCYYAPPLCRSKMSTFGFQIKSESEQNKIKLNMTTIYHGRDILILADELDLCDDGNISSNKENLLEIGKLLGVEAKNYNEIPINGWNMVYMETEGREIMQYKQIF